MPHFDPTVSWGTVITCTTTVVAAIYTVGHLVAKLEHIGKKQELLDAKFTAHELQDHESFQGIQASLLDLAMARKSTNLS